ncbi:hypothetical protein ACKI1Z_42440, partial [Streptomyces galilaeus]|uniref:hypothetical protein n=1 Tax=Streptomyces galilaeus TaxID=33899 RepID=UPI0038F809FF
MTTGRGGVRHIREQAEFLRNDAGRVAQSLAVFRDVTDYKIREAELTRLTEYLDKALCEAEGASRAKSEFLAHMSH